MNENFCYQIVMRKPEIVVSFINYRLYKNLEEVYKIGYS